MSFITYSSNKYHVKSPGLLVSPLLIKPLGLCAADSILEVIHFTTKDFKSVTSVQGKALSSWVCSSRDNGSVCFNTYLLIFFSFVFILPFFDSFNKVIISLFQNELLFKILTGYFYDVLMGRILN